MGLNLLTRVSYQTSTPVEAMDLVRAARRLKETLAPSLIVEPLFIVRRAAEGEVKYINTAEAGMIPIRATAEDLIIDKSRESTGGLVDATQPLSWIPSKALMIVRQNGNSRDSAPGFVANIHLPPRNRHFPADPDPTCPPSLGTLATAEITWEQHVSNGNFFLSQGALDTYRRAIRALRSDPAVVRIVDGYLGRSWMQEGGARFVYYRDPRAFIGALCDIFQLRVDTEKTLHVLSELAKTDTLSGDARSKFPKKVAEREGPGGVVATFRRLRYTDEGGIICEAFRYGVETGESLRTEVWADGLGLLVDRLVSAGVASFREDRRPPRTRRVVVHDGR